MHDSGIKANYHQSKIMESTGKQFLDEGKPKAIVSGGDQKGNTLHQATIQSQTNAIIRKQSEPNVRQNTINAQNNRDQKTGLDFGSGMGTKIMATQQSADNDEFDQLAASGNIYAQGSKAHYQQTMHDSHPISNAHSPNYKAVAKNELNSQEQESLAITQQKSLPKDNLNSSLNMNKSYGKQSALQTEY